MTNNRLANMTVTATAAMLATATVAFAMSSAGITDPTNTDLPVVQPVAAASASRVIGVRAPVVAQAPSAQSDESFVFETAGPPVVFGTHVVAASPAPSEPVRTATSASIAGTASGPPDGSAITGAGKGHDGDDEHEVVRPKVRETEDPEDPEDPEDLPKADD
jgi:hypothetical protein